MYKKSIIIVIIFILIVLIYWFVGTKQKDNSVLTLESLVKKKTQWLKVEDGKIKNQKGETVLLQGISSHGIQWFSELLTEDAFKYLKEEFNINTFRIAIYVRDDNNYDEIKQKLYPIVDELVDLGLYVIIDWHTLEDGNPNSYIEQAKLFFEDVAEKYAKVPNVIYEICNEPNGTEITWEVNIKPYAEELIPVIRNKSPKSLIIVGTEDYCKKFDVVADNALDYENILYAVHFYSGTDKKYVRKNIEYALNKNVAVFASEWGTTDATGNGKIYEEESKKWIQFLREKDIGYVNWSFCNKNEGSAILKDTYTNDNIEHIDEYLTDSGKLLKEIYTN